MEMRGSITYQFILNRIVTVIVLLLLPALLNAQPPVKKYMLTQGNMHIVLSKNLSEKELDDFILQYNVGDLALKQMIKNNFSDSIIKRGWTIDANNKNLLAISKPLLAADRFDDPSGRLNITINTSGSDKPVPLNNRKYGINIFRKQAPFSIKDSFVVFTLNGRTDARKVSLAGSFTNWQNNALPMTKTNEGWILPVKLMPGKHTYKFIVDDKWITDPANTTVENDGEGNNNSVFYVPNSLFKLDGYTNAKKVFVAGSFANWEDNKLRMNKTNTGWELPIYIDTGTYTYRFIVDNNWMEDPANSNKLPNEFNEYNSVISVGRPVLFTITGLPDAKQVFLAGSFNNWREFELPMTKTKTGWELSYVLGNGNYEYKFFADGKWIDAEGYIVKQHTPGSIFVIDPNYTFRLKGYNNAKTVYLAGDFNGWSPNAYAMKKEGDEWVMQVHLTSGKHLYKFVIDGNWIIDPGNQLWEENEHGTGNSVLWIK